MYLAVLAARRARWGPTHRPVRSSGPHRCSGPPPAPPGRSGPDLDERVRALETNDHVDGNAGRGTPAHSRRDRGGRSCRRPEPTWRCRVVAGAGGVDDIAPAQYRDVRLGRQKRPMRSASLPGRSIRLARAWPPARRTARRRRYAVAGRSDIDLPCDQLNLLIVEDAGGHHPVELPDVEAIAQFRS